MNEGSPSNSGRPVERTAPPRGLLLATDPYLARRSPPFVAAVAFTLVVAILVADVFTGPDIGPSLFYLLPVALAGWRCGRVVRLTTALFAAVAWTSSQLLLDEYNSFFVASFNVAARFAVLCIVAELLARLRALLEAQRDLAKEAMRSADQLRDLNEMKDTLLRAVSHDLRGPLTGILGAAQTLLRRRELGLSEDDAHALIDGILRAGRRLYGMVSDLLDLERLERGGIEPDLELTDVGSLVARVVHEANATAPGRVRVHPVGDLEVEVDPAKFERVVENLVGNAMKHTPAETPIEVLIDEVDDGILLCVDDRGPGVPDGMKTSIFEAFRQGPGARGGVGVGLSLVKRFVELHEGRAWVEDRPGGGASFRVFLPRSGVAADRGPGRIRTRDTRVKSPLL